MLIDDILALPKNPGVYEYFDKDGKLLYVGKAKNLKNRVRSYFSFSPTLSPNPRLSMRIARMINQSVHLEYIITDSESDALILENSFIKQLKPKYNILLRDDKTYPYIYIDLSLDFPRFEITRKVIKGKNVRYFGPYFKGSKEILNALYLKFPLVQKKSCIKGKKACLFYQIKRCNAPCENKILQEQYSKIVDDAIKDMQNPASLVPFLQNLMINYANNENYEEAAIVRDQIQTIKDMQIKVEVDLAKLEDFDVIAIKADKNIVCSVIFNIRNGKISNSRHIISMVENASINEINELYKQIIIEAYPKESPINSTKIYTYEDFEDKELVAEILSKRHMVKFKIQTPKIGEKRKICDIAYKNCDLQIQKHLKNSNYELLNDIKQTFDLNNTPFRIEIFDNSHMQGVANVGSMVSFELDHFIKDAYRHAHLQSKNDYDQMNEFLTLRAKRFDKLNPPDLWIIDGGQALLDLASLIIQSSGANVDVIAISKEKIDAKAYRAKGNAKDKIYTKNGVFKFETNSKILQFIQKLRDEAHRFAISFHQKTKRKMDLNSSKMKNLRISDGSIKKLLNYYGSFDKIYEASFEEIKSLTNIKVANKIKNI